MPQLKTRMRVLRAERGSCACQIRGASRAFINAVEKGRYQPGLRLASKIVRAFRRFPDLTSTPHFAL